MKHYVAVAALGTVVLIGCETARNGASKDYDAKAMMELLRQYADPRPIPCPDVLTAADRSNPMWYSCRKWHDRQPTMRNGADEPSIANKTATQSVTRSFPVSEHPPDRSYIPRLNRNRCPQGYIEIPTEDDDIPIGALRVDLILCRRR